MVFSYIMGNLVEIIKKIEKLNVSFDDGDKLSKFFGLLKYLNGQSDIDEDLKRSLEEFFDHSWQNCRNIAISTQKDFDLLDQLPK